MVINVDKQEVKEQEIEVTPEMIQAGLEVLAGYDPDSELQSGFVIRLFEEMLSHRQQNFSVPIKYCRFTCRNYQRVGHGHSR